MNKRMKSTINISDVSDKGKVHEIIKEHQSQTEALLA